MSRIQPTERTTADVLAKERRRESVADPVLMAEVDRLLSGRTRHIRLKGLLRELYRERTFAQSSQIVRHWMAWVIALDLVGIACNYSLLSLDAALQALVPCAIVLLGALSVITCYRGRGMPALQDASLAAGTFVILLAIALVGAIAGPDQYERYTNIMIFGAITAIVIFPIPLAWTWTIATSAFAIHAGMQLWNPLIDLQSAVVTAAFFGVGLIGSVHARRAVTVITQKSFLLSLRDLKRVSDLAVTNERLATLARTDPLTGVANRRWMTETLDALWQNGAAAPERVAILMCDVDHFKGLNDALGHIEGDRCLREVSNVIRDCIRPDIDHVARYGGEEFLVLLTGVDAFDARLAAERICRTVEASLLPNPGSTVSRYVTVSIGFSTIDPVRPVSAERLQRQADEALYRAKSEGRNRVVPFDALDEPARRPMLALAVPG